MTDPTHHEQVFPVLTLRQRQDAAKYASSPRRYVQPGELVWPIGQANVPAFLLLRGSVEVYERDILGRELPIIIHQEGEITGEVNQLAGRPALAEGRAGETGCEILAFDRSALRALVVGSAQIGELVLRAFILRRNMLLSSGAAGIVLLGERRSAFLHPLEIFLTRNAVPYTVLDPTSDKEAATLIERFAIHEDDLPVAICPNGTVIKRPTEIELGVCAGLMPDIDTSVLYDLAIIGSGPAGLASAVYAASEGLRTVVVDSKAYGGQAGTSARIENYLGFPQGISGLSLTTSAFTQAQKFGAEIAIPLAATSIEPVDAAGESTFYRVALANGGTISTRCVVVASGARYRKPAIPNIELFEGSGVTYWATKVEADLCDEECVTIVGAGNSAGQAIAFLSPQVRHVDVLVRGASLEVAMSRYLIDRIAALDNVTVRYESEIVSLQADEAGILSAVNVRTKSGAVYTLRTKHVFIFIGADPNTEFLKSCQIALDGKGFVLTGEQDMPANTSPWKRKPMQLEASLPGVFAVGDVRSGSTKRVAAAVGEGAAVVAQIHAVLAGTSGSRDSPPSVAARLEQNARPSTSNFKLS